jgi:glycosyltransferase involved in cell wall biosynthesis
MHRKIKLLHIIEATTGGTRRHLKDLLMHLDTSRFEVSVICSTLRDKTFMRDIEKMQSKGIKVHIVQMVRNIHPLDDFSAFLKLTRLLHPELYDIVHTHSSKAGFLGRLAGRIRGIKIIVHTPHVFPFEMDVPPLLQRFYLILERLVAPFTDRFICVSNTGRTIAIKARLGPPEKFTVIENGIEPVENFSSDVASRITELRRALNLSDNNIVVGTVGRLTRQKGYSLLIDAVRLLLPRYQHLRLVIVGEGELESELRSLIKSRQLSEHCIIIHPTETETMLHYYSIFDIFVLPSLWEGLPYSLLDAMAMAKPVVAFAVGGVQDVLENRKTGLLVPPQNKQALADAISQLIDNKEFRCQLGNASAETVRKKYRLEEMVKRTEKLYELLLEEKQNRNLATDTTK